MKPGATIMPEASRTRSASEARTLPISAILPSLMPTSARTRGMRRPSTTIPPRMAMSNSATRLLLAEQHGQAVGRAEGEADDAAGLCGIEPEVQQPIEQRRHGHPRLHARKMRPEAEVLAETERDVLALVRPLQIEAVGIRKVRLVVVGRSERQRREAALRDADAMQLDVARHLAGRELHRRVPAQGLLDEGPQELAVGLDLRAHLRMREQREQGVAAEAIGRLRARRQQQPQEAQHLLLAEPFALDLGVQQRRQQIVA